MDNEELSIIDKKTLKKVVASGSNLFKNYRVFSDNYVPPRIVGRKEQTEKLAKVLARVTKNMPHDHVLLHGKPGTGKTAITLYVLQVISELLSEPEYQDINYKYLYVNCRENRSELGVLEALVSQLTGEPVNLNGISLSKSYGLFKKVLGDFEGFLTIILDEADNMTRPNSVLYNLTRLNVQDSEVSLILITNKMEFREKLEARVISTFPHMTIHFPAYTAPELEMILWDRVREGVNDGVITEEDGVVQLCAAMIANEDGSARKAIQLLKTAITIAENEGSKKVTTAHVRGAYRVLEDELIAETIKELPKHLKLTLLAVSCALKSGLVPNLTTGEAYALYKKLCRACTSEPVSQRRFSDFLNQLDEIGLVNVTLRNAGRGLTRKITIERRSIDNYLRSLSQDEFLEPLMEEFSKNPRSWIYTDYFE